MNNYKVSEQTALLIDANKLVNDAYNKAIDALKLDFGNDYDAQDCGLNESVSAMKDAILQLIAQSIGVRIDNENFQQV